MLRRNVQHYVGGRPAVFRRPYGLFQFLFDLFFVCLTGGLWLIWIFVREMRGR